MAIYLDEEALKTFVSRVLNPENTARIIHNEYDLNWIDESDFTKTLYHLTRYDDYIDLLEGIPSVAKRRLTRALIIRKRTRGAAIARWRHVIKKNGSAINRLLKACNVERQELQSEGEEPEATGEAHTSGIEVHPAQAVDTLPGPRTRRSQRISLQRANSPGASQHDSILEPELIKSNDAGTAFSPDKSAPETPKRTRKRTGTTSTHFPSPSKRVPAGTSSIPFPPLTATMFGLVQEGLRHDPYALLIAVMFLNKTAGRAAMPIYRELMALYPTPEALSQADPAAITGLIYTLGLQTQRAKKLIALAGAWLATPPLKGRMYRTRDYPAQGDGRELSPGVVLEDAMHVSGALEIGHLPGCGPYAFDSWRIFCRDVLRGVADGHNGEGAGECFEPEWKRVLPKDKELTAYLRWMWLKEGWVWDPLTGSREVHVDHVAGD